MEPFKVLSWFADHVLSHGITAGVVALVMYLPRFLRRRRLKPRVEQAYMKLRKVCEPNTLDPDQPGNRDFMKSDARDFVNPLRHRLQKAEAYPPPECTTEDCSLLEWFRYLGQIRSNL